MPAKIRKNGAVNATPFARVLLIPKTLSLTMTTLPTHLKQGMGRFSLGGNLWPRQKYADLERRIG